MFKTIPYEVWAFDLEWVPDVASGRRAYRLGPGVSDADVLQEMWRQGGADADNPRPYLKTVLCRIVSIAAVVRKRPEHGPVTLTLQTIMCIRSPTKRNTKSMDRSVFPSTKARRSRPFNTNSLP